MKPSDTVAAADLRKKCDPASLPFETTADLEPIEAPLGQSRAVSATRFAVEMRKHGYHLFVMGPSGTGKHRLIRDLLAEAATLESTPPDFCYVHDFDDPHVPRIVKLPAGRGRTLYDEMTRLVEDLRAAIPAAFESEEYRRRLQEIEDEFKQRQESVFHAVQEEAQKGGVAVIRMPSGVVFAPIREGEVLSPDEFEKLTESEQKRIKDLVESLQSRLQKDLRQLPQWGKQMRDKVRELNREVTRYAVEQTLDETKKHFADLPAVVRYLDAVRNDVIENADDFRKDEETPGLLSESMPTRRFARYSVNLLVDNSSTEGAPVLYEDRPSTDRLVGHMEHRAQFGALVSDFTMIRAGALHRANGGYLLLDARKVVTQPYAWETLKRMLFSREVRIESMSRILGLSSTESLEPEPIPLDVQVVLFGDRQVYYLLSELDSELEDLFKVVADFEEHVDRDPESEIEYARAAAGIGRREGLKPFDRGAVAELVEIGSRRAEDSSKLSVHLRDLTDLLKEADRFAERRGGSIVERDDVKGALAGQIYRQSRVRERLEEAILEKSLLIDTSGERIGQINGLSVISLGKFPIGHPMRITATARVGDGKLVDIEREVELGGAVHSKGVLILGNYLASRFARDFPLSLSASLVFEQSYGGVDGDSASLAELCALISALSGVPIRQAMAVTGSVNQLGRVQPIGGVNEKIEGFYDICKARGLSGEQRVLIPKANLRHLMLRADVVEACQEGQFGVIAVASVDEAIELLTGRTAGAADEQGEFPEGSVNQLASAQLMEFAVIAEGFSKFVKIETDEDAKKRAEKKRKARRD